MFQGTDASFLPLEPGPSNVLNTIDTCQSLGNARERSASDQILVQHPVYNPQYRRVNNVLA